jgi:hypothetical protein
MYEYFSECGKTENYLLADARIVLEYACKKRPLIDQKKIVPPLFSLSSVTEEKQK